MTPFPPTPFSSGITPATQALAFSETPKRFPGKGATPVKPLPRLPDCGLPPSWGGPAKAA
jgi:hypothetical protein